MWQTPKVSSPARKWQKLSFFDTFDAGSVPGDLPPQKTRGIGGKISGKSPLRRGKTGIFPPETPTEPGSETLRGALGAQFSQFWPSQEVARSCQWSPGRVTGHRSRPDPPRTGRGNAGSGLRPVLAELLWPIGAQGAPRSSQDLSKPVSGRQEWPRTGPDPLRRGVLEEGLVTGAVTTVSGVARRALWAPYWLLSRFCLATGARSTRP